MYLGCTPPVQNRGPGQCLQCSDSSVQPGFHIVFPPGSASVSAFVKHWFLLPLPLGALGGQATASLTLRTSMSQHDVGCKALFLPPPPLEGASCSPAGPGPPARMLPALPLTPACSALPPRGSVCPLVQGPLRPSRVTSPFAGATLPSRMDYRLQELLEAASCGCCFILRPPLSTAPEPVLCRCSISLSSFQGWWLGRDHRGGLGSSDTV